MRILASLACALLMAGCALDANLGKWDFGTVYVGETHTSSAIIWTNTGGTQAEVAGIGTSFNAGDPFVLQPAGYTASKLAKGQSTSPVQVVFSPVRAGTWSGSLVPLQIASSSGVVSAETVAIEGVAVAQKNAGSLGIGGGALVVGSAMDFGKVPVNANPAKSLRVDIINTSANPVQVNYRFKQGGQGYSVEGMAAPVTLKANGGKITVKLRFSPPRVGRLWDAVEFFDVTTATNMAGTALAGEGVAP